MRSRPRWSGSAKAGVCASAPWCVMRLQIDPHRARLSRMRRTICTAAQQHDAAMQSGGRRFYRVLVTMTYRPGVEWAPQQISETVARCRTFLHRRGLKFRAAWCLEFHVSGRPHYHLAVWLPVGVRLPHFDAQGWWAHGMTNVKRAERAGGYLAKYLSKSNDLVAATMKGARGYGVIGLSWISRAVVRYWRAPVWLNEAICPASYRGRHPRGGHNVNGASWIGPYSRMGEYIEAHWSRLEAVGEGA